MSRTTISRTVTSRAASEPLPRNVKLALRSIAKQQNKASALVKGPLDPPTVRNDICVTKVVETNVTTSPLTLTYNGVYKLLDPGSTAFFNTMRVMKISCWSNASTTNSPSVSLAVTYDGAQFQDRGIATTRPGTIHCRLPEFVRETWKESSSTDTIGVVTGTGAIVQVTIEVRANAFGDT